MSAWRWTAPAWLSAASPLQIAVLLSLTVHAALLSVRIGAPEALDRLLRDVPLEVILVNTRARAPTPPERAPALAQTQLAGGGDAHRLRATSPLPTAAHTQAGDAADTLQRRLDALQQEQTQLLADLQRALAQIPPPRPTQSPQEQERWSEKRRQMLALLAEIEQRIQHESARPRKHYVSPATREVPYALYYDALKRKIEARGTRHFPERNGQKLYGELTMILTVNSDGRVLTTEVVQPSGVTGLDRHAQAIATAAGPFGRFSREMRQQADQLAVVTRFVFARNNTLQTTSAAQER